MPSSLTSAPRAIIYARYSNEMQNPLSVEDQFRVCRREARRNGWTVVGEQADHAFVGSRNDRPGLQALEEDVRNRRCEIVVVELYDRISRDPEYAARFYKIATHFDVEIFEVGRGRVTPITLAFSSTMAALYLEDLAMRVHRGHEGRVEAGKSPGGRSYGYTRINDEDGKPGDLKLVVQEAEAAVVRRIFEEYAGGRSPLRIAADLNSDRIGAPSAGTKRLASGHWKQNTINGNRERGTGILNNELYVGRLIWNRLHYSKDPDTNRRVSRLNPVSDWITREVPELRIVEQKLWEAVKARQAGQTKARAKRQATDRNGLSASQGLRRRKFLLSGLLECGLCGGNMTIAGSGKTRRYYCANAKEKGPSVCTGMPGLAQGVAEEAILSGLRNGLLQEDAYERFRREFAKHLKTTRTSVEADLRRRDKAILEHEATKANLLRAIEGGSFSQPIIDRLNAVDAELAEMKAKREAAAPPPIELPENLPELYRDYVGNLVGTLSDEGVIGRASDELHEMIDRIVVRHDRDLGGHELELEGALVEMLAKAKPAGAAGFRSNGSSLKLVAGAGFEPAAFRL